MGSKHVSCLQSKANVWETLKSPCADEPSWLTLQLHLAVSKKNGTQVVLVEISAKGHQRPTLAPLEVSLLKHTWILLGAFRTRDQRLTMVVGGRHAKRCASFVTGLVENVPEGLSSNSEPSRLSESQSRIDTGKEKEKVPYTSVREAAEFGLPWIQILRA